MKKTVYAVYQNWDDVQIDEIKDARAWANWQQKKIHPDDVVFIVGDKISSDEVRKVFDWELIP